MPTVTTCDLAVVGLGAMGSAVAANAAHRGAHVIGFEQFSPAHDRGSAHGSSRLVRASSFEGPAYVPLAQRSMALWRRLEERAQETLFTPTGALFLGDGPARSVREAEANCRRWDVEHEMLDSSDLRRRFPTLAPQSDTIALFEPQAGCVHPERAIRTFLRLADESGAALHFGERVVEVRPEEGVVLVRTPARAVQAARVALTAGAWTAEVLHGVPRHRVPMTVERQFNVWVKPDAAPGTFAASRHPFWIWETRDGYLPYGFPDTGDGTVKLGVFHGLGQPADPDRVDRLVSDAEIHRLLSHFTGLPAVAGGTVTGAKVCLYANAPDKHFVIAALPGLPEVVLATAFSGHGFKFAPAVGDIVTDLALDGETSYPVEPFTPARFEPAG